MMSSSNSTERGPDIEDLGLAGLVETIWNCRKPVIVTTLIFALSSICYALLATEWYEAEVLLAPAEDDSVQGLSSQFGGLASLAGVSLGREGVAEPIAVLRSREFVRDFIESNDLMPILYSDEWDEHKEAWISPRVDDQPDLRDAVRLFREDLLQVSENSQTGLVTMRLEWKDPVVAASWATKLVAKLNNKMRQRALKDAEKNVEFLREQINSVNTIAIQQSIGRLLESELQKLMLARGNEEFSFKIIDPASPPKYRSRPKRTLLVVSTTILGGMVGLLLGLVMRRPHRANHSEP